MFDALRKYEFAKYMWRISRLIKTIGNDRAIGGYPRKILRTRLFCYIGKYDRKPTVLW